MTSNTISVTQAVALASAMGFDVTGSLTLDQLLGQDENLHQAALEHCKQFKKIVQEMLDNR